MDREIPKQERNRKRNIRIIKASVYSVGIIILISIMISAFRNKIYKKDLTLSTAETGSLEISYSASGKVVPAFEEIINSPIDSRIVEVYKKSGDSVDAGPPLLKLDLQSTETDYRKMLDEEQMKKCQLEQLEINNRTALSDIAMNIKISEMKVNRMKVELRNEKYLDSLGSGTTDKVRKAELDYNTGVLQLEQLRQQYENEKQVKDADLKVKELDYNIYVKSLAEMKRTLDEARILSPHRAILTYINNQIGARVSKGSKIAIVSDLRHFKVDCEIADTYGNHVKVGGKAIIRSGSSKLEGIISNVTPLSQNGVIDFTVQLKDNNNKILRSGLKTDVYVMSAIKDNVLRIGNDSYYMGAGNYNLFVLENGKKLVRRNVELGESNFEYVEVTGGLKKGDQVVISDMSDYKNKNEITIK
jgi:HlyD family secretion protein